MRREHKLLLVIILISSFFFYKNVFGKILISRVQISGVSTTDEFVELYNYSSTTIPLSGWSLKKATASGNTEPLVSNFGDFHINPFGYFLIGHHDYSAINGIVSDTTYTNSSNSLAANNSVLFFDNFGKVVDQVDWGNVSTSIGNSASNPAARKSLARLPNDITGNYIDTDNSGLDFIILDSLPFNSGSPTRPEFVVPTPASSTTETSSSTAPTGESATSTPEIGDNPFDPSLWNLLKINEFLPNPASGTEWVELFNRSSSSISLSGGSLCDSRTSDCTIAELSGNIEPKNWLEILISGSKLNNDGDSVILKNPEGIIIDQISYGGDKPQPDKGQSYARTSDGVDTNSDTDWAITTELTPGGANIIAIPPQKVSGGSGSYWSPGNTNTQTEIQTVPRQSPAKEPTIIWNIKIPTFILVNTSTVFDAHSSVDPRGGEILFTWDFGDKTFGDGSIINHSFTTSGIFTVTVTATSTAKTYGSKKITVKVSPDTPAPAGVTISGIYPRPDSTGEEWIAITNFSASTTDVSSWNIGTENDKWYSLPRNSSINANQTLRFYHTATKLSLNNDGGKIILALPTGKPVDIVEYGKSKIGQTYLLTENIWNWDPKEEHTTTTKTVGKVKGTKIYHTVTVAEAKNLPAESSVWIVGTVNSLPGKPGSNYFYLSDDTGGIQIYSYKKVFPEMSIGDKIRVYGNIGKFKELSRVKTYSLASFAKISSGKAPSFTETKSISEVDESDIGKLINLEGEITKIKSTSFFLDDGTAEVLVNVPKDFKKGSLAEGDLIKVSGIVETNNDGWKILPRFTEDIIKTASAPTSNPELRAQKTQTTTTIAGAGVLLVGLAFLAKKMGWVKIFNK